MSILNLLYDHSPYILQSKMFSMYCYFLHHKRYGDMFYEELEKLDKSQWFSDNDLIEYQNEKLRDLIKHAYKTVPYYYNVIRSLKLTPDDFKTIDDLQKLPLLSRVDVLENCQELLSTKYKRKELIEGHTSGTTGSPLHFYWDQNMWFLNNVFDWRQKSWAGFKLGDPYCVLLGRPVVSLKRKSPPFWQYNKFDKQLWLSSFHLGPKTIGDYFGKILEFSPKFIEGYPSTLYIIAKLLADEGHRHTLRATLTSSETLYLYQKDVIKNTFCCENFDFYGLAERTIWATECEVHKGKHLNMEYGITEVVDDNGQVLPRGKLGYLVGTSLLNYGMPFIRYKTTDISSISLKKCKCGRELPLMGEVTTKAEDLIYTPSGKYISSSILTHPFKPLHHIEMSQIVQERVDLITIKIVKRRGYTDQDSQNLLEEFTKRVGADVDVQIKFVDSIPREKSGKFKWVISKLNKKGFTTSNFQSQSNPG